MAVISACLIEEVTVVGWRTCQVNLSHSPNPVSGKLPSAGPYQTVLTTSALEAILGISPPLTAQFSVNTTAPQQQGTPDGISHPS